MSGQTDNFFELVSDGNMSLIRAVEKFDFARGNKFSTYASWAIMKNFARTIPDEHKRRDRFRTSQSEMFAATEDARTDQYEQESAQIAARAQIGRILERLDEREQKIIISRFGLDHTHEPLTLKEVGEEMGVTKERIRQIEARALAKLRLAATRKRSKFRASNASSSNRPVSLVDRSIDSTQPFEIRRSNYGAPGRSGVRGAKRDCTLAGRFSLGRAV